MPTHHNCINMDTKYTDNQFISVNRSIKSYRLDTAMQSTYPRYDGGVKCPSSGLGGA